MNERVEIAITEEEINKRLDEIAEQINKDYEGESVHLICILKGSVMFLTGLAKRLKVPVTMDFMSCSSYGSGTVSKGLVKFTKDLDEPIEDKNCIIVEDIVDSGNTLSYLKKQLNLRKPKSLKIVTLLSKPARRKVEIEPDYTCFIIDDYFAVGYGLDYDQRYRNLPYVGILHFDD